ncbi:MAG: NAD-dependent DNA ligase LigA [Spirochaetales bacterium]|nr:NAD-dependent DNA ligase LigA [Spirochaetales bacterium]
MIKHELTKEIRKLSDLLSLYQNAYYINNKPLVSDLEYDRLYDRLLILEQKNPDLVFPGSPSMRIGSDLAKDIPEVTHTIPVLSLDKGYSVESIRDWMDKTISRAGSNLSFVVEEKIDGVSIVLYYKNGILDLAATRGNGSVGNDITDNVRTIKSVPLRLTEAVDIVVRGEIFLPLAKFENLNSLQEIPFANPRNLTAGTLRRKKSIDVAAVPLDIFIYEGFLDKGDMSHIEILGYLKKLGFKVSDSLGVFSSFPDTISNINSSWFTGGFDSLSAYVEKQTKERPNLSYEIDGLVIKVNETDVRKSLGFTGHHPRWAIAYKFESPEGTTTIKGIDIQVGRTGRITPVARIVPVLIGGSTISNVTLHNQDYINLLELSIGDTVSVSKRGDVIPAVERVVDKNEKGNTVWQIPPFCPSCKDSLIKKGAHLFCNNPQCPDQIKAKIFFFLGKNQMDIDNFGPETADFLIEQNSINRIPDIYSFNYNSLEGATGFGSKKIKLITDGVSQSINQPYRRVLPSLGIPELGKKAVELLINAGFRDVDDLIQIALEKDIEKLVSIKGIGERTAEIVISEFSSKIILDLISDLKSAGLNFREEEVSDKDLLPQVFSDQIWCITGSFENFKPRSLAGDEITKRGGKTTTSVTGKTNHLLAGDSAGSKLTKAQNLGTNIVSENEFMEMLKING